MYFDTGQNTQAPRAREDGVVKAEDVTMIEKIYAKRGSYFERRVFWWWHQEFAPELTYTTMLEF